MFAGMLAGLVLIAAAAQDAPGTPASDATLDDVIVDGRSIQQQAQDYVAEIGEAPGRRRLARWDRRICVGVTGLDAAYAQFLVDRVSAVAASVGLNPGDPGCRPEVLIAFTRDPDSVAQAWVAYDLNLFRPSSSGQTDLGADALERFEISDAPIRWWHVSLSVNAHTGLSVTRLRGADGPPANYVVTPSLIQSSTREALKRVFIVVDANQISQTTFGSLSDYLALVALTQIDPLAETGDFDTVLNLFSGQSAARLSAWDFEYLQALYRTPANPIRASAQERRIVRELADRRTPDVATTPSP